LLGDATGTVSRTTKPDPDLYCAAAIDVGRQSAPAHLGVGVGVDDRHRELLYVVVPGGATPRGESGRCRDSAARA
jgi:hypothetical protein